MALKIISIEEIKYLAHWLAQETMSWNEPIPDFETRYPNVLESCIVTPFQKYERKYLYQGLTGKAAILFYLMIKNHPFQNGNKRIAVTTLLVFLYVNNKWLRVGDQELYNFSIWIAQSPPRLKEQAVESIKKFIEINIEKHPKKDIRRQYN